MAISTALIAGIPILYRAESDLINSLSTPKRLFRSISIRIIFKMISGFLYSYALNRKYYQHFGVECERLFFCPCAVDNEFFRGGSRLGDEERVKLRKKLGILPDATVFLFVGKLIPRKRPEDIIRAFARLDSRDNAHLLFVGDGSEQSGLEELVVELVPEEVDRVTFVGHKSQKDLPRFYGLSDVFVLPSESDRSPKVVNEAMVCGLPIITTTGVGTGPDLVIQNRNGFIYRPGDLNSLSNYIARFLSNPELASQMGNESQTIVEDWNFQADVDGILEALEYVTSR